MESKKFCGLCGGMYWKLLFGRYFSGMKKFFGCLKELLNGRNYVEEKFRKWFLTDLER